MDAVCDVLELLVGLEWDEHSLDHELPILRHDDVAFIMIIIHQIS